MLHRLAEENARRFVLDSDLDADLSELALYVLFDLLASLNLLRWS